MKKPMTKPATKPSPTPAREDGEVARLEHELATARESLRAWIDRSDTAQTRITELEAAVKATATRAPAKKGDPARAERLEAALRETRRQLDALPLSGPLLTMRQGIDEALAQK